MKEKTKGIPVEDLGKIYDASFPDVTRVEVINNQGRMYSNYDVRSCDLMLQDSNKTLKIFLK